MEQREEYWREQIHLARSSGLTMKAWCEQQHMTLEQMKYWVRKLGLSQRKSKPTLNWLEVPVASAAASSLVVQIGTAHIEVTAGFDPVLLKQIIQSLEKP